MDEIKSFFGISKLAKFITYLAAIAILAINKAMDKFELGTIVHLYSSIKGIGQKLKDSIPLDKEYQPCYKFPPPNNITIPSVETLTYKIVKINSSLIDN